MDGRLFGAAVPAMREAGDIIDAEGLRLMRLQAYGVILPPVAAERAISSPGEVRRRGRPRKGVA